jgi:hypothetical protein
MTHEREGVSKVRESFCANGQDGAAIKYKRAKRYLPDYEATSRLYYRKPLRHAINVSEGHRSACIYYCDAAYEVNMGHRVVSSLPTIFSPGKTPV